LIIWFILSDFTLLQHRKIATGLRFFKNRRGNSGHAFISGIAPAAMGDAAVLQPAVVSEVRYAATAVFNCACV
jgi:hypothetical protein